MKLDKEINPEINQKRIKELEKIFPEIVNDGQIDFDKFKELFKKDILEEGAKFGLEWFGKKSAEQISRTPSQGTLRPSVSESKNWDKTKNLYIEGDNLEVLKLMQKSYAKKVDVIYIDPPYNTGNDFVYNDSFDQSLKEYKEITNQVDENNNNYSTNKEGSGRYHSNWLSMMYPRLKLARNLLKEDGVIFISIDDNEQARLKILCDEIFGESNFVANINWQSSFGGKNDTKLIPVNTEYILCYSYANFFEKNIDKKMGNFPLKDELYMEYGNFSIQPLCWSSLTWYSNLDFIIFVNKKNSTLYISSEKEENTVGQIVAGPSKLSIDEKINLRNKRLSGKHDSNDWCFYWSYNVIQIAFLKGFIYLEEKNGQFYLYQKTFEKAKFSGRRKEVDYRDNSKIALRNIISDSKITSKIGNEEINSLFNNKIFSYPKPIKLIQNLLSVKNKNILIVDFFSGSASTAHAIMKLNAEDDGSRKFIMVQLPEKLENLDFKNISEIGKERIRRAGELILKENKELKDLSQLDIGFRVLKLDTSNLKKWEYEGKDNLQKSLFDNHNNIINDRTALDLLYESIIKLGLELNGEIIEYKFDEQVIYTFNNGRIMVCFDKYIGINVAQKMIDLKKELKPPTWKVVFSDYGFKNDIIKTNIRELIRGAIITESFKEENGTIIEQDIEQDIDNIFNSI